MRKVVVADGDRVRVAGCQQQQDLRLKRIGVLELVHENVREAPLKPAADRRVAADEIARMRGTQTQPNRVVTIQGDRDIEFKVLQKVMYTLGQNGYENISLAVLQKS